MLCINDTRNVTVFSGVLFHFIALKLSCCWQNSAVAVLIVTNPLVWRDLLCAETKRLCVFVLLYCCTLGASVIDRSSMQSSGNPPAWFSWSQSSSYANTHTFYHSTGGMCEFVFGFLAMRFHRKTKLPNRAHAYMWVNSWK